ncbi:MAG TPA: class I SAM-dependent methyltransferase [Steroidobacteraceae bacterium]|nr:class I SAM-dependent methyltransferase [Steroidobacteraceae bacterium]
MAMQCVNPANAEQAKLWSGLGANGWIELKAVIDRSFVPITDLLLADCPAGSGGRLLDVGCGTGDTTLAAARRLGPKAECVGLDISEPMIEVARSDAQKEGVAARFLSGDAQTYAFAPDVFDWVISRFGVLFFDDPVRAFTNLRSAARGSAKLRVVAWRGPAENPFMTTAERAVAPLLPAMPPRPPDAPGQFAFARREHVAGILERSGWADIQIKPVDVECVMPEKELVRYFTKLGPLARVLPDMDAELRRRVIDVTRAAFTPFVNGDEVRFVAGCWMVSAAAR